MTALRFRTYSCHARSYHVIMRNLSMHNIALETNKIWKDNLVPCLREIWKFFVNVSPEANNLQDINRNITPNIKKYTS
jgi:hypothetical protein